jgi:hypothetical protein
MVEKRFLSGDAGLFPAVNLNDTVSTFAYEDSGNSTGCLLRPERLKCEERKRLEDFRWERVAGESLSGDP